MNEVEEDINPSLLFGNFISVLLKTLSLNSSLFNFVSKQNKEVDEAEAKEIHNVEARREISQQPINKKDDVKKDEP